MRFLRTVLFVGISALAAGCQTAPETRADAAPADDSASARYEVKEDAPQIAALKQQNLEPGQCGMLLWTLKEGSPVMVFRNVAGGTAEMIIDGKPSNLTLVEESGERRYGVSARQRYTLEEGTPGETRISVSSTFGLQFEGGVYVEEGVISLRNFFGWERVTPVAGLAGCRA